MASPGLAVTWSSSAARGWASRRHRRQAGGRSLAGSAARQNGSAL